MTLAEQAAQNIVRDCCELEPYYPDLPDAICLSAQDLRLIVDRNIAAALREKEGWVLVPSEPTLEMLDAAKDQADCMGDWYRAMLAAAPEAPAQPEQEERGDDWPAELSRDRTERARFGVVVDSLAGLWIDDDDFIFDASIKVDGEFPDDATKRKYLDEIVRRLNGRAHATYQAGQGGQGVVDSEFIHELLWGEYPECCGNPVVGAEYMGQVEMVCCGCPEPSQLSDAQIVAALRERFPEAAAPEAPAQPEQGEREAFEACANLYREKWSKAQRNTYREFFINGYRAASAQAKKPMDDYELRGLLAANLTCWHRLTEKEAENLIQFVRGITGEGA